ncbi:hypothetical protein DB88DRAFT_494322 [Papiliotrema laurentii]|uniref:Uncharacterized protein n=1 Tax=Papiliotrema laurentii TaxID=5418 RepID=A0AAD9D1Q8_PAPLA|nr:hypothetical protein DB88DRAFT_494322 [Papiliotrema laurentii]
MAAVVEDKQAIAAAKETQPELGAPVEVPETKPEVDAPAAPDVVAAGSTAEPVVEAVKQPTTTHAESGTAHTDAEPATQIDGTQAQPEVAAETSGPTDKTTEAKQDAEAKGDKQAAAKEKVEKTKSEGRGFFAKLFGSRDKSPKKEKKKTPKAEKADPIASEIPADTTAPAVEPAAVPAEAATTATAEPVAAEVPVATSSSEAPANAALVEPEAVKETETAPAAEPAAATEPATTEAKATEEPAAAVDKKEEHPKGIKATRRISARFTHAFKHFGKKEEKPKDAVEAKPEDETAAASSAVAHEAPQLETPAPAQPFQIEEPSSSQNKPVAAPPAAPVVSAAA